MRVSIERIEGRRHAIDALGLNYVSRREWPNVASGEIADNLRRSHGDEAREYSRGVMEVLHAVATR